MLIIEFVEKSLSVTSLLLNKHHFYDLSLLIPDKDVRRPDVLGRNLSC